MDKRTFLKNSALASAGILIANQFNSCKIIKPEQIKFKNWVWAHPHVNWSADTWKMKVNKAVESGIHAMLVEVYNGTNTFYEGGQLPMIANVFEKIIPVCQASGMELHAWMWTMPCNAPQIIEKHPEWYAYNGFGQPAHTHPAYVPYYKFLCPCHPGAQEFIKGNVTALAKITELAGVHLDYVRLPDVIIAEGLQPKYNIVQDKEYPPYDYSYSPSCREQFKAKHGIDPLTDIKEPATHKEWVQFRRDSVTHLVNDILVPEAKKYNKQVTAAVFPNWGERQTGMAQVESGWFFAHAVSQFLFERFGLHHGAYTKSQCKTEKQKTGVLRTFCTIHQSGANDSCCICSTRWSECRHIPF
jgi:uncharacterized lipoprotein YddW (UPF0748 family)